MGIDRIGFIGVTLERFEGIEMPITYGRWLDEAGLVQTFDVWWSERLEAWTHSDAQLDQSHHGYFAMPPASGQPD